VLFIVTAASIFAWLLTVSQAAQLLSDLILSITENKWVFLILVNLLVLFVGCFLDTIAAITDSWCPFLLPIVLRLGIDPVHFGLILTLNLMIGLCIRRSAWCCSCCRGSPAYLWSVPRGRSCRGSSAAHRADLHHLHSGDNAVAANANGADPMTSSVAATLHGPEDLRMVESALEPLAPGMVRVRFGAGGICGSDMHYFRHARTGDFVVSSPLVLGHEVAGEVVEIAGERPDSQSGIGWR
jgi:hypothetical protein